MNKGVTEGWYRPTWTPDGRVVAAGGLANPGIFVSDEGLKKMTRIDDNLAQPTNPAVSPDGTKVGSSSTIASTSSTSTARTSDVVDPEDTEDAYPTWSPDGSQIAYRVSGRIKIIPAGRRRTHRPLFDRFPEIGDKYFIFSGYQFSWR